MSKRAEKQFRALLKRSGNAAAKVAEALELGGVSDEEMKLAAPYLALVTIKAAAHVDRASFEEMYSVFCAAILELHALTQDRLETIQ